MRRHPCRLRSSVSFGKHLVFCTFPCLTRQWHALADVLDVNCRKTGGFKSFKAGTAFTSCKAYHGGSSTEQTCSYALSAHNGYSMIEYTFPTALTTANQNVKVVIDYTLFNGICSGADGDVAFKEFTSNQWLADVRSTTQKLCVPNTTTWNPVLVTSPGGGLSGGLVAPGESKSATCPLCVFAGS